MAGTVFSTSNWTGYDEQSATNPSGAITDFSLLINIADLSSDFNSNVQSDGADIRLTKGDDTELPYDLIDWAYNAGSPTGLIRVKWSGTLAASGTQNARVWAGYTGGTAVAYDATETFGSDNAYDSGVIAYLPEAGTVDRTSSGHSGTANGGVTVGGGTGPNGEAATDFDGTDDYVSFPDGSNLPEVEYTVSAVLRHAATLGSAGAIASRSDGTNDGLRTCHCIVLTDNTARHFSNKAGGSTITITSTDTVTVNAWNHVTWQIDDTATSCAFFLDGVADASNTQDNTDNLPNGNRALAIGANNVPDQFYDGLILHVLITSDVRSAAWIAEESDQTLDNATFWGTWAWTEVSTGVTGTIAQTLPFLSQSASGTTATTGTVAQSLPFLSQSASGLTTTAGTIAQTLPFLSQIATGGGTTTGTIAQTLSFLSQSASGTTKVDGTIAQTLPFLSQEAREAPELLEVSSIVSVGSISRTIQVNNLSRTLALS